MNHRNAGTKQAKQPLIYTHLLEFGPLVSTVTECASMQQQQARSVACAQLHTKVLTPSPETPCLDLSANGGRRDEGCM